MTDRFQIVLCKPQGFEYAESVRETMESVREALALRGEIGVNSLRPGPRPIVFCAQHFDAATMGELPEDAIIYNLEQLAPGYPWHRDDYLALLRRFAVWDGSARNVAYLRAAGIAPTAIQVPPGYSPCLTRIPKRPVEDVDVLFYGVPTERRLSVLRAIGEAGLNVVALDNVWGTERDAWIARAKVVLNLHAADGGEFEAARVIYLLANRKAVVTESFGSGEIDADLQDGLVVAPYSQLADACIRLVCNEGLRHAVEERGFRAVTAPRRRMDGALANALAHSPQAHDAATATNTAVGGPRRRILILGHSAGSGGAESLLIELAAALRETHELLVLLPATGELATNLVRAGIACRILPTPWWAPTFAACADDALRYAVAQLGDILRSERIDLVVTNTGVLPAGALAAHREGIPHVYYLHEDFVDDPDLMPDGCTGGQLVRFVAALADEIWCDSSYLAGKLAPHAATPTYVLPPFFRYSGHGRDSAGSTPCLLFVNVLNWRKNPDLFVDTLDYLHRRGIAFTARIVGAAGNAAQSTVARIARAGLQDRVAILPADPDPLAYVPDTSVLVQTATTEPFGLIVGEAIRRGIPVVTTPCGGPADTVAGLKSCRVSTDFSPEAISAAIIDVLDNYPTLRDGATEDAIALAIRHSPSAYRAIARERIAAVARRVRNDTEMRRIEWIEDVLLDTRHKLRLDEAALTTIVARRLQWNEAAVCDAIAVERNAPGTTMNDAFAAAGAPPHFLSPAVERVYVDSPAVTIELAATMNEPGRLSMATFIATRLLEYAASMGKSADQLRLLAIGDGIASDSLRLLHLGFAVDYADLPGSLTQSIAAERLRDFVASGQAAMVDDLACLPDASYDVAIMLEVLEHLADPWAALLDLARLLRPGGRAFVSEHFVGVEWRWPAHLVRNVGLHGATPALCAAADLWLSGYNRHPAMKPYEFVKGPATPALRLRALTDPAFRGGMAMSHNIDPRQDFAWRHVLGMPGSSRSTTKEVPS